MDDKIFLFGLENAGKTTLCKYIKDDSFLENPEATRAFNIDQMIIKSIECVVWDAPGQKSYRDSWSSGFPGTSIFLFVLDTSDAIRFDEAKKELDNVVNNLNTRGIPLMVCFHKMDLEDAQANYVKARGTLKLPLIKERPVQWLKTSAKTGEGIEDLKSKLVELIEKSRW